MSPPSPQRRLSVGTCRRYRVPLDYSQGLAGGNIIVTVKRFDFETKSDGQLWIMQGGPGMPSHPLLGLLAGLGKVSYALDHRGTGWSTVLDCPKVRSKQPGKLPWGNSWMKGLGFGNVSTETVDACLAEISGDIGAPKHFTAANAARDLASVIMAIQAETGSTADVGIRGLSYGTLWARRFLELQGQEFPVIVSHVGIDGVCGGDYDFGQFALAANRAGQRLLDEYCDAGCRGKLGAPATGSVALWFGEAVKEIDKAIGVDGSGGGFCGKYFWERFAKSSSLSGWTAQASAKEALGSIGYLHFSGGFSLQKEFVTLVLTLRRCVRDTSATTIPSDFWAVVPSIDDAVRRVEDYRQNNPTEFSEMLHLVVSFGDLWKGPPELHAWGLEDARHGNCSLESWRDFFDEHVFWAPDFVTLMSRYQDVFNKYGYRENSALVHSNGHPWSNVTVLVTNGDLDGQTPLRSARATFEALPTCKAKVELPTGGHCVSGGLCLRRVVAAFYRSPVACSSGSVAPAASSALGEALEAFDSGSCKARTLAGWWPPAVEPEATAQKEALNSAQRKRRRYLLPSDLCSAGNGTLQPGISYGYGGSRKDLLALSMQGEGMAWGNVMGETEVGCSGCIAQWYRARLAARQALIQYVWGKNEMVPDTFTRFCPGGGREWAFVSVGEGPESLSLGGRKKQQAQEWAEWKKKEHYGGKWQYWPGSWPRPQQPELTRYDQMPVPTANATPGTGSQDAEMEAWDTSSAGTALMLAVQKTLTLGRKAEGKARRLKEELQKRDLQWQAYVKTVRARYHAQKKQYQQDLQRLPGDMKVALEHSQAAAQQVIRLVNGEARPEAEEQFPTDDGWDELVAAEPAPTGDYMQAALLAAWPTTCPSHGWLRTTGCDTGRARYGISARRLMWLPTECPLPRLHFVGVAQTTDRCALGYEPHGNVRGQAWCSSWLEFDAFVCQRGLAEVAQLAEDVDTARRIVSAASAGSSGPDPLPVTEGVPSRRAPDFVDRALQLPRGPPPPCPMCVEIDNAMQHTVPAVVEEVPFSIWVGAPGYQPQVLQFQLGLPCDIEDALEATARHIKATKPPFYDRVAVKPQPFHTCAAAILTPDWASYSALSLVCLDLRDAVPEGLGPVVPVFVTRPTSRAELLREAGIYGVAPLNVFVGTDPLPVQDDESIVLANGCLVTFLRRGCCPNSVNDLQYRLQYPRIWDVPAQFPKQVTGQTSLLLLLHRTGTYLLRTKALTDTPHEAVARFVGVEHESVTFHTPSDDALRNFVHKGVDVRGVIALVTKAEVDPVAVFLDLRQIGGGVRYVALAQPHIPFADLNGYAGRSPPPSWHVQVHGGRRQHDSLAVCSGETLVFGFQHVDPDSTLWSPPSLPDDDDDEEEDADHDEDEEEESDDSSDSAATTRSRSRGRARRGPGDREPSSDHSYQGGLDAVTFPFEGFQGWLGVPTSRTDGATSAASTISAGGTVYAVSGCNKPVPAVLHSGSQSAMYEGASSAPEPVGLTSFACVGFTGAGVRCIVSADFPGALGSGPENFLDSLRLRVRVGAVRGLEPIESLPTQTSALKYAVAALLSRFLAEPSTTTPAAREALDALRRITGALGGPWPLDGPGRLLPLEPGETEAQPTDAGAQLAATHKRIAVCVLVPDYVAEHHTIRLQLPATPAEFQQTLEQARLPEVTMRFPYLVAALPQPRHGMGVFVGLPHWDCSAAVVCMDMTAIDGRLYAAVAPAYADRAILCDIADLPEAASVHIYVGVGSEPVEGEAWAHLVPGITVSFRPHGVDFQPGPSLDVRLLSADGWQEEAEEIGPNADGVYCLVFGHRHRRFLSDPGDPLHYRQRLAAAIGADSQRLCIAPAVPRVPDIAIDGAPCRTALAVALPEAGVASPQLVLVDCRPLFEGWVCWRAYNGRLLTQELLQDLRFSTPVGYDVEVSGARVDGAHLLVGPGCVLTADFVKREVSGLHRSPTSIQEPSPGSAIETTTHDAALGPVSVGEITSQPPVSVPDVGERAALNYTSVSAVGRALSVLVAVPSYLAELHEVTITPPVTPQNFVEQVHARRSATDVRRFPRLVEVAPQPDKQFAMFVALPAWPTVLCTICIDARRYDGRLFAVSAPVVVDLASLRTIVDIPADANVRIFMRDVPWPVEAGAPLGLSPGDLFTVLPHDGTFPQVAGLRDVLNTFSVPEPSDAFAGDYGDRAWLVTDSEPILYEVDRRRGIHVRADVAAAIGTSVETLVLCSARPRIHDFADQGRLVRTVMLALARPFPGETASEPLTPLLLDMFWLLSSTQLELSLTDMPNHQPQSQSQSETVLHRMDLGTRAMALLVPPVLMSGRLQRRKVCQARVPAGPPRVQCTRSDGLLRQLPPTPNLKP
ncbi:HERC2 [Symbiodinium microadriaticum]|nr:HERC2 [Symbiodinium microadriaticum]